MQFTLPDILKQQPKKFWAMLKTRSAQQTDLSLEEFSNFNREVFFDEAIPPDRYTPLADATT
jgi:hypothetical protein